MAPESFSMRVAVSETLKGENFEIIEEAYTHCSTKFELKEKVVIFIKPDIMTQLLFWVTYTWNSCLKSSVHYL